MGNFVELTNEEMMNVDGGYRNASHERIRVPKQRMTKKEFCGWVGFAIGYTTVLVNPSHAVSGVSYITSAALTAYSAS